MKFALSLLACWQPERWTPPPPPDVAVEALDLAPALDADGPVAEADAEPQDDAPNEARAEDEASEPTTPPRPPYTQWTAKLVRTPATVVGDNGEPQCVLNFENTEVLVIDADEIRFKVRVPGCGTGEGWLQAGMLAR